MAEKHTSSRAASHMSGSKSKSKSKGGKHPHELHIRRGKSGGFIVRHTHKPDPDSGAMPEETEDPVSDLASLHQHIDQNMGDQPPAPAPAPDPNAAAAGGPPGGAPMPAAGGPPAGM